MSAMGVGDLKAGEFMNHQAAPWWIFLNSRNIESELWNDNAHVADGSASCSSTLNS
jgi:hypothetical protein